MTGELPPLCHSEERKRRRIFQAMPLRREKRFFASLRMTMGGQNDRGWEKRFFASLRMTGAGDAE